MRLWPISKKPPKQPRIHAWLEGIEEVIVEPHEDYTTEIFFRRLTSNEFPDGWLTGNSIWRHGPKGVRFRRSQAVFWLET